MVPLPEVKTLQDAVIAVISNNKKCGYNPTRFIQLTEGGFASDLLHRCERLMMSEGDSETLERAVREHPGMLLLEDFIVPQGREWGFSEEAVRRAEAWLQYITQVTGRKP
jgi:hypothetical protein